MFLVRRGRIHIYLPLRRGKKHHLATFCQGDFFGEMAFLDREARSASAEAVTKVDLFALSRPRFEELTWTEPALGAFVLEHLAMGLSRRLRVADTELGALEDR